MNEIEFSAEDGVAVVKLNRPESLNALNFAMHEQLQSVWARIKNDSDIRAVVITGTGRAFCVGVDLHQTATVGYRPHSTERVTEFHRMTPLQNGIWRPTIVAVNGACVAGGLHFLADADYVLVSDRAYFSDAHVSVGQVSALEPLALLPRIGLGASLALSVMGSAVRLDASAALRCGLANEIVPHNSLMDRAHHLARAVTESSPSAIEATKRAIWASLEQPLASAQQVAWDILQVHRSHPDAAEGPKAFAEKRMPRWTVT